MLFGDGARRPKREIDLDERETKRRSLDRQYHQVASEFKSLRLDRYGEDAPRLDEPQVFDVTELGGREAWTNGQCIDELMDESIFDQPVIDHQQSLHEPSGVQQISSEYVFTDDHTAQAELQEVKKLEHVEEIHIEYLNTPGVFKPYDDLFWLKPKEQTKALQLYRPAPTVSDLVWSKPYKREESQESSGSHPSAQNHTSQSAQNLMQTNTHPTQNFHDMSEMD